MEQLAWHQLPVEDVLEAQASSRGGLSPAEAADRLAANGPNRLPESRKKPVWLIILSQLRNPLTFILLVAASLSLLLHHVLDAIFICAVIVTDMTIGAGQEWRAEMRAAALKHALHLTATVIRNGHRQRIDLADVVPGDIVHLESGDAVPADLRLLSTNDLHVDESLLTGESQPVEKGVDALSGEDIPLADRTNMAFAGTMVATGRGAGIVCATASQTELGSIAKLLSGEGGKAPLLLRMEKFSNRIAVMTVLLALLIGLGQFARGAGISDVFLLTTALAVSAIPEGLPMAITVALSVASNRMSRRNVIVRHLPAVEALGSCTIIASDKTGTLTANRLTITRIILPDGTRLDVEGEGFELEGKVSASGGDPGTAQREALTVLARAAALSNEATLKKEGGTLLAEGDSVDLAFLVLAEKLGLDSVSFRKQCTEHAAIGYESQNGYSASLRALPGDEVLLTVKGAPEVVLPMCSDPCDDRLEERLHELTGAGFRVLAVAQRRLSAPQDRLSPGDLSGLDFLGFAGLIDPLRSEVPEAVEAARRASIDIRMITGDHPETALAIARDISPDWRPEKVLTGRELSNLEGTAQIATIREAEVFARVEPAQKHLIVSALQDQGHFVAVTGDGVNDAPALKKAHVGIAMGAGGTDVARAASDLIITDDNFASIVAGIEEGRAAYDNIRKIVWLLISTAIAEVVIFALALLFNLPVPLTAVQILWLNLVTEGIQDVALAFEGKEPDLMRRSPRRPTEPIFNRQMIEQCVMMGLYVSAVAFGLFYMAHEVQDHSIEAARNVTLLFLVLFNNFHTLNCRSETRSFFAIPLHANPMLIGSVFGAQFLHIAAMHLPFMQRVLDLAPVSFAEWGETLGLAATVFVLGELYKALIARPRARQEIATLQAH